MARYSPTVRPGEGVGTFADLVAEARRQHRTSTDRRRRDELTELELAERGIRRGEAPTREREVDPPDYQSPAERSAGAAAEGDPYLSGALSEFRNSRVQELTGDPNARAKRPGAAPQLTPGQFVPGMGFADAPIGMQAEATEPVTVEEEDPRYEQLTDDFYREDPEFLEDEQTAERRAELAEAIGGLRRGPTARSQADALDLGVPPGVVFPDEPEGAEPNNFTVQGREFDTLADAVSAYRQFHPLRSGGDGGRDEVESSAGGFASYWASQGATADEIAEGIRDQFPALSYGDVVGLATEAVRDAEQHRLITAGRGQRITPDPVDVITEDALRNVMPRPAAPPVDVENPGIGFTPDTTSIMRREGADTAAAGGEGGGGEGQELTVITPDQADYLREVEGWTDEQIEERYIIGSSADAGPPSSGGGGY